MEEPRLRDRVRSARNVLVDLINRGATQEAVQIGDRGTVVIRTADESGDRSELDLQLADDRILSLALSVRDADRIAVASTELFLYAKAKACGIDAVLISEADKTAAAITEREIRSFNQGWHRIERSDTSWTKARRGVSWLQQSFVRKVCDEILADPRNLWPAQYIRMYRNLESVWTPTVSLSNLMQTHLNTPPPRRPNLNVILIREPGLPWAVGVSFQDQQPRDRRETADERNVRIRDEERRYLEGELYACDQIDAQLGAIHEYFLDRFDQLSGGAQS